MKNIEIKYREGFTLIELSIIMIVIGLLIGGIISGSELVKQSKIRSTISEINSYKAALNVFKNRFNALPGDYSNAYAILPADPNCPDGSSPSGCNGNGDTIINSGSASFGQGYEDIRFWQHLAISGMIGSYFKGVAYSNQAVIGVNLPVSKLGSNIGYYISNEDWGGYNLGYKNYLTAGGAIPNQIRTYLSIVNSDDINNIDKKLDDGFPKSGIILAVSVSPALNCLSSATSYSINVSACTMGVSLEQ